MIRTDGWVWLWLYTMRGSSGFAKAGDLKLFSGSNVPDSSCCWLPCDQISEECAPDFIVVSLVWIGLQFVATWPC